jgi:5-methyltetrahydrofolate--homocysteine methyltransferase
MVHVAKEMKRRKMKQPLLIGGATTSRMHTAVKIAEGYDGGVVHVLDASRSVTVAGSLLNEETKPTFLSGIDEEYAKLRADFAGKRTAKQYISFAEAQANPVKIEWEHYLPPKPSFTGIKSFETYPLQDLRHYIDWTPFFITWEFRGRYPEILSDSNVGVEATKLFNDANAMLDKIIEEHWLQAKGVIGFWEAGRTAPDTITLKRDDGSIVHLEHLRQQIKKAAGQPNFSLADFIAPSAGDHVGGFAVSIHGIEPHVERFAAAHDDYNKIMLQALADRLAEAFAELLHHRTRTHFWGYAPNEKLTPEELIKETYQGIRPAPGYPACPDHTEKYKLFELLNATETAGIQLTESLAMYPAASVCGWYFSHPRSSYFGVGKISPDQLEDYARRKNMSVEDIGRWLSPILD